MSSITFLSIILIIIIWEGLIQHSLYQSKKYTNKIFVKKYLFNLYEVISNRQLYINYLMHSDVLQRNVLLNKISKEINTSNYIVSCDEMFDKILPMSNIDINYDDITLLINQYPILRQLRTGQILSYLTISNKKLQCLIWSILPQEIRVYNRINTRFTESIIKISQKSDNELNYIILFIGELSETFINSVKILGLHEHIISDIICLLQYQLDFKRLRRGDRFAIAVSIDIDDIFNQNTRSKLLGVRLHTSGKNYYAFRANNGKFYDCNGIRLGKNFMPFPVLKPFRISSDFNLNRLNPITRRISPHSGVDFAVPIGTKIFSVGDGEVIIGKYSKVAGNYVVIQHNSNCITRYMHLKKILVKPGQKVKCGEIIALSGNTGRSTGPHLHFEVWINQKPVNPLTTSILNIETLSGKERVIYLHQMYEIFSKLHFD